MRTQAVLAETSLPRSGLLARNNFWFARHSLGIGFGDVDPHAYSHQILFPPRTQRARHSAVDLYSGIDRQGFRGGHIPGLATYRPSGKILASASQAQN